METMPGELRILEPVQKLGAECGPGYGCGNDGPAQRSGEGVSEAAAQGEVDAEGDEVGKSFEEDVRVDPVAAHVEIEREASRGMG
jgi:hypothetical protein